MSDDPGPAPVALPAVTTRALLLTTPRGTFTATLFSAATSAPPAPPPAPQRPALLLLHGLADLPDPSFAPLARRLVALGFAVVAPHSRGMEPPSIQGAAAWSGYHATDLALDVADWVGLLLERRIANDVGGVVLVGHNVGAVVAQTVVPFLHECSARAAGLSPAEGGPPRRVAHDGGAVPSFPAATIRAVVLLGVPPMERLLWRWWWHPALLQSLLLACAPFLVPGSARRGVAARIFAWLLPRVWRRWSGRSDARTAAAARGVLRHYRLGGTPRGDAAEPYRSLTVRASTSSRHSCASAAAAWHRCLATTLVAREGRRAVALWTAPGPRGTLVAARSVPTLALRGAGDGLMTAAVFRECCGGRVLLPGAVSKCVAAVPGCGHWLHQDDPDAVAAHIAVFVARFTTPNVVLA